MTLAHRCRRKVQNEGGNADEADFPELLGITLSMEHGEFVIAWYKFNNDLFGEMKYILYILMYI